MGSALMGSLQMSGFCDTGTFWVLPLTCFYISKSARAYLFPNLSKFITSAVAPSVSTPFVRSQLPPEAPENARAMLSEPPHPLAAREGKAGEADRAGKAGEAEQAGQTGQSSPGSGLARAESESTVARKA